MWLQGKVKIMVYISSNLYNIVMDEGQLDLYLEYLTMPVTKPFTSENVSFNESNYATTAHF